MLGSLTLELILARRLGSRRSCVCQVLQKLGSPRPRNEGYHPAGAARANVLRHQINFLLTGIGPNDYTEFVRSLLNRSLKRVGLAPKPTSAADNHATDGLVQSNTID